MALKSGSVAGLCLLRLSVPRDRDGRFRTALFAPYQRRTGDIEALALAMYAAGVSTRKVGEVLGHLLGETYSASTISRVVEGVLPRLEAFRRRPLKRRYAFVYLDALFVKVFREGEGVAGGTQLVHRAQAAFHRQAGEEGGRGSGPG